MKIFIFVIAVSVFSVGFPIPVHAEPNGAAAKQKELYTCPMHPQVKSDHPGDCPICHMRLVKVKTGAPSSPSPKPSPAPKASTGDRKIKYYRHPMDPSVHSKVPAKDSMGMDYIPVYEDADSEAKSDSNVDGRASFHPSPEQLKLSGTRVIAVERKDLVKELRVPGRALGGDRVAFQVYENDLDLVRIGMEFQAGAPALAGENLAGQVVSIDSILDPMTRTARVNGILKGKSAQSLRTEASIFAMFQIQLRNALSVPESAIFHTGTKDLVFVFDEQGAFHPRAVTLGSKAQGFYEIKAGVKEGEKVSAGPNFLLDSESRIQSSYDPSNH